MFLKESHNLSRAVFFTLCVSIISLIFYKFSWIDIIFSRIFYDDVNRIFFLHNNKVISFIDCTAKIVVMITALALLYAIINEYRNYRRYLRLKNDTKHTTNEYDASSAFALAYLSILFILYLTVTANGIKIFFHRARPFSIEEFGGALAFTPAFVIGSQCLSDCAFVSGHSSAGFMFFGLIFLLPTKKRSIYMWTCVMLLGAFFGMSRIAGGRHFLSDVVFSGIWTFTISWLIYVLFFEPTFNKN